jgi:hypothetical protein
MDLIEVRYSRICPYPSIDKIDEGYTHDDEQPSILAHKSGLHHAS